MKALLASGTVAVGCHCAIGQAGMGMYYVSGRPGEHGIWLSVQDDQGQWPRGNPVLLNGSFDGDAVDPDVVRLDDGTYRLYYFKGYFVTQPPPVPGPNRIYSAASLDGIGYTVNGIAFEHPGVTDPSVVKLSTGHYLMACTQMVGTSTHTVIARSTDGGLTFAYLTTVQNTGIPELHGLGDGSVRLFHNGPGGIVSKRSYDGGTTWQAEAGWRLPSTAFAGDPSVVRTEADRWWLFVKGFNGNGNPGPAGHQVMLAESTDGTDSFTLVQPLVLDSASVPEGIVLDPVASVAASPGPSGRITVHPNPFSSHAVLSTGVPMRNARLQVFDALGRAVMELSGISGPTVTIARGQLPGGMYFAWLTEGATVVAATRLSIGD